MTRPEPRQHDGRKPRVLAVSSGGGHWVQLLRLKPAFADCDVAYATVVDSSRHDVEENGARFHLLPDATRWNKLKLIWLLVKITLLVIRERPDAIITTGAAPGYLALMVGRILGRKTCWIDSIANVDELSMSGRKARRWATLWLTQWEHLAGPDGPLCFGNVISSRQPTKDDGSDESGPDSGDTRSPGIVDTKPSPRTERIEEPDAPRVLAISSGGGHWVELMRLRPAFEGCSVTFASVSDGLRKSVEDAGHRYHRIPDLTRWNVGRVPWAFIKITRILLKERPTVIITTGAGPGYIACIAGKLMGIRCCWVDSIANADELSMSGVKAGRWIDLLLTQWPKLANHDNGAQYKGNVL